MPPRTGWPNTSFKTCCRPEVSSSSKRGEAVPRRQARRHVRERCCGRWGFRSSIRLPSRWRSRPAWIRNHPSQSLPPARAARAEISADDTQQILEKLENLAGNCRSSIPKLSVCGGARRTLILAPSDVSRPQFFQAGKFARKVGDALRNFATRDPGLPGTRRSAAQQRRQSPRGRPGGMPRVGRPPPHAN